MQFSWFVIEVLVEFIREDRVLVNLALFKALLIWLFRPDHFSLLEWLDKEFGLFTSLLLCNEVEMYYLLVVLGLAK